MQFHLITVREKETNFYVQFFLSTEVAIRDFIPSASIQNT